MPRRAKIYTRTGDDGTTALGTSKRVPKDALRVIAYGGVDELNSAIGLALALGVNRPVKLALAAIQNELFILGAELAFPEEPERSFEVPQIEVRHIEKLETLIDDQTAEVGSLKNFILPGGSPSAAQLHVARTICRRAERDVVTLANNEAVRPEAIKYLNRLSDALFTMARFENHSASIDETLWDSTT